MTSPSYADIIAQFIEDTDPAKDYTKETLPTLQKRTQRIKDNYKTVFSFLLSATSSSTSTLISAVAAETISGGKAVAIHEDGLAYVYNINDEEDYLRVFGIAKQGVTAGQAIDIYIAGTVTEAGSGWQYGKVYYVSATGVLIPEYPISGISKKAAIGIATDTIFLTNNTTDLITIPNQSIT